MKRTALLLLALMAPAGAHSGELWFNVGSLAYHFRNAPGYNNVNYGFGVEYQFNKKHLVIVGTFRNSINNQSEYIIYAWTPLQLFNRTRAGIAAAVANGYEPHPGQPQAGAAPTVIFETRHVGLNFIALPKIKHEPGLIAMQIKFRF
jgi:hypothetical protein